MGDGRRIRVLISKIGLDGHDVGAKVLVQWLRDQGMEVIYTGLRQTVEQVVEAALQEAVDVVGVSILSGSHLPIANRLLKRMAERGIKDTLLLFGGTKDIEQTIKTVMYASTPFLLLGWIPFIGIFGALWSFILWIIGVKELHEISSGRAAAAVILAALVILIFIILIAAVFLIAAVSVIPGSPMPAY